MNFKSPFSRSVEIRSSLNWLKEHIVRLPYSTQVKEKAIRELKESGYKREFVQIDKVTDISPKDFYRNFYLPCKPVILKGAAKQWKCMEWDFDFFKDNYGDEDAINTNIGDLEVLSLGQAVDSIRAGNLDKARVTNVMQNHPELMQQADLKFLSQFIPKGSFKTSFQYFMGNKRNFTPLHAGATNNFQIQIAGDKEWHLIDPTFNPVINPIIDREPLYKSHLNTANPDFEKFPEMQYIPIIKAHLEAGDILFNPTFYWHQVQYLNESIAIGLRWLNLYSMFKTSPSMVAILATATNPPALVSYLKISGGKTAGFYK